MSSSACRVFCVRAGTSVTEPLASVSIAFFSRYLPSALRTLKEEGSEASHSTSGWSMSGSRTSSECAMLARPTFVLMSPTR